MSRHKGTIDYFREKLGDIDVKEHVNSLEELIDYDVIIGNLPITAIALLKEMGKRFILISLEVPRELRGKELSKEELEKYMKLVEIEELKIKEFKL